MNEPTVSSGCGGENRLSDPCPFCQSRTCCVVLNEYERRLAECRKVLAFYADERNYREAIDHPRMLRLQCVRIAIDGGQKATDLLTRIGGK